MRFDINSVTDVRDCISEGKLTCQYDAGTVSVLLNLPAFKILATKLSRKPFKFRNIVLSSTVYNKQKSRAYNDDKSSFLLILKIFML